MDIHFSQNIHFATSNKYTSKHKKKKKKKPNLFKQKMLGTTE